MFTLQISHLFLIIDRLHLTCCNCRSARVNHTHSLTPSLYGINKCVSGAILIHHAKKFDFMTWFV